MRALGESVPPAEEVPFSDVVQGEWYYEPIAKALNLGVANGYEDGTFGINENISREDMMVMAYRTLNALGISIPANKPYASFSDQSSISDYAVEAIERMYCADIINGVGDNMLDPKGAADRAQSAKIIYGLLKMEGTVNE
ncbi:MAG: S-layer homology domain-containing protein [Monoglobus pectinilyticus]